MSRSGEPESGDAGALDPPPDRVGRYLVWGAFARGGMASVHLARVEVAPGVHRLVAMKRLAGDVSLNDEGRARLREEARILARLRHPAIVPLVDVVDEAGELALVLEYVHGLSLASLVSAARQRGERLPPDVVVAIVVDALRGLGAAHSACDAEGRTLGLVHRDVSPQNIVVGVDGAGRLLDFGVAKALGRAKLTATGATLGKVVYMSPEQRRAQPLSPRSDLYSVGVVLWECLAGRPFTDALEAAEKRAAAPPPSAFASNLPLGLDAVVARALASEPARRFATATELESELVGALPPAPAKAVAELVERLGADELERRSALARRVETYEEEVIPPSAQHAPLADEDAMPAGTTFVPSLRGERAALPVASPTVVVPGTRGGGVGRSLALLGVAAVTLVGVAAWTAAGTARRDAVTPAASVPLAAASPAVWKVPAEASAPLSSVTAPPVAPPLASVVEVPVPRPSASVSRTPRGEPRPARPAPSAVSLPAAHGACDPPFSFDEEGRKRYKPECLR